VRPAATVYRYPPALGNNTGRRPRSALSQGAANSGPSRDRAPLGRQASSGAIRRYGRSRWRSRGPKRSVIGLALLGLAHLGTRVSRPAGSRLLWSGAPSAVADTHGMVPVRASTLSGFRPQSHVVASSGKGSSVSVNATRFWVSVSSKTSWTRLDPGISDCSTRPALGQPPTRVADGHRTGR
jgi:hypothetical protein